MSATSKGLASEPRRALAADVDGTLLRSDHTVSPVVASALAALTERGFPVTLVSARSPRSVVEIAGELGLTGPVVALNGAVVANHDGRILYRDPIDERVTAVLVDCSRSTAEVSCNLYRGFDWYVPRMDSRIAQEAEIVGHRPETIETYADLLAEVEKILLLGETAPLEAMMDALGSHRESIRVTFSKPGYLEITARSASKARALSVVADHHGLVLSDFVAIGDAENDLPMLRACGTAVAMANAAEDIKRMADLVVATNDRDGVAECVARCFPALLRSRTF